MQPKAKTMQERMGFSDPDLSSPKHDEMVIWLLKNKVDVCRFLLPKIRHQFDGSISKEEMRLYMSPLEGQHDQSPSAKAEVTVMNGTFTVGFIDVLIEQRGMWTEKQNGLMTTQWSSLANSVAIEVKPTIPSFGETLRQIRQYQQYCHYSKYAIFSPDHRFKEVFEEQGITVFSTSTLKTALGL